MNQIATKPIIDLSEDTFATDVCDWFSGRRAGHMSKWLYSEPQFQGDRANGAIEWAKAVEQAKNGSPYYVFREEEAIIRHAAPEVSRLFDCTTSLVDLGPGSRDAIINKIYPIRQNGNGHIAEYIGVDVSEAILGDAKAAIFDLDKDLAFKSVHRNFYDSFLYPSIGQQIVTCFFGLTICNMTIDPRVVDLPEKMLSSYFSILKGHMGRKPGYLLVTQDINQDEETLRDAYMTRNDFYRTLLHRIERDIPIQGNYDPDAFDLDMRFFEETQAFGIYFVPNKAMSFSIGHEEFNLERGQELYFHNAFKFDIPTFQRAAFAGGFEIEGTIQNGSRCVLHVLKQG